MSKLKQDKKSFFENRAKRTGGRKKTPIISITCIEISLCLGNESISKFLFLIISIKEGIRISKDVKVTIMPMDMQPIINKVKFFG
ncbi:MAG: hypothetical protein ACK5UE_03035 [Chitinophagales bacterium]